MSTSDQLISDGVITQELSSLTHTELKEIASDPNAVFFYSFIQAKAKVL